MTVSKGLPSTLRRAWRSAVHSCAAILGSLAMVFVVGVAQAQAPATPDATTAAALAPAASAPTAPPVAAGAPASAATTTTTAPPGPEFVERLQVADPFIELRTGPGRGYPVFHVVERRGWIRIELRRTDWYRVRTENQQGGEVGWVHRSQLDATLTEVGTGKTFRDLLLDDYLGRRVDFGVGWGRMRAEPMVKLYTGVRLGDTLGAELTLGQVQGTFAGSDLWHLALISEPWGHKRWSPFLSVGFGRFRNVPNTSLVQAQTVSANLGHAGVGLRWYLSERFVARLDWSLYTSFVSDERSIEYRATTLGVSFFF